MAEEQDRTGITTPVAQDRKIDEHEPLPFSISPGRIPELNQLDQKEVVRRRNISAVVVHEAVREEGERELRRHPVALAWSGLSAGLAMGFSMVTQGLLHAYLPHDAAWTPLLDNFGYCMGFLIVVLGRMQLFTEDTLKAVLPLLVHPTWEKLHLVLRLWGVVFLANIVGALIFAAVVAHSALFPPEIKQSITAISHHSLRGDFGLTVLRAIFAGWLIALMVWLLPAAEGTRVHIIILITYLVALGGFAHIIAGSVDVLYLVNIGSLPWYVYLTAFMLPTLIGNIIGGVSLVAVLNFAQVASEKIGISS